MNIFEDLNACASEACDALGHGDLVACRMNLAALLDTIRKRLDAADGPDSRHRRKRRNRTGVELGGVDDLGRQIVATVLVRISGGAVQNTQADQPVRVLVRDYDVDGVDDADGGRYVEDERFPGALT